MIEKPFFWDIDWHTFKEMPITQKESLAILKDLLCSLFMENDKVDVKSRRTSTLNGKTKWSNQTADWVISYRQKLEPRKIYIFWYFQHHHYYYCTNQGDSLCGHSAFFQPDLVPSPSDLLKSLYKSFDLHFLLE